MPNVVIKQRESTRRSLMKPLPPERSLIDWTRWSSSVYWGFIAVGLLIPITLASCSSSEATVSVFPVSGKVTFNGAPAEGAQVLLHAKGHALPPNIAPMGTVKADGTFQIGAFSSNDGAPAGDYIATVVWRKIVQTEGGAGRGPNVLPAEYAKPDSSPLKITVKDQGNDLPIEIKK